VPSRSFCYVNAAFTVDISEIEFTQSYRHGSSKKAPLLRFDALPACNLQTVAIY